MIGFRAAAQPLCHNMSSQMINYLSEDRGTPMTTHSIQDRRNYGRVVKSTAFHQAGLACAREMLILSGCNKKESIRINLFYLIVKSKHGWYTELDTYSESDDFEEAHSEEIQQSVAYRIVEQALAAYCEVTGLPMPTWEQLNPGRVSEKEPALTFPSQYPQRGAWYELYEAISSELERL